MEPLFTVKITSWRGMRWAVALKGCTKRWYIGLEKIRSEMEWPVNWKITNYNYNRTGSALERWQSVLMRRRGNNVGLRNLWKRERGHKDAAEMTWLSGVFRTTPWLRTLSHLLRTPQQMVRLALTWWWYSHVTDDTCCLMMARGQNNPETHQQQVKAEPSLRAKFPR